MRDGTLIKEFEKTNRRLALLLTQFEWVEQRQQAREQIESNSTLRQRVTWFFKPERFLQLLDAVHLKIHQIEEAKMVKMMDEAKTKKKILLAQ